MSFSGEAARRDRMVLQEERECVFYVYVCVCVCLNNYMRVVRYPRSGEIEQKTKGLRIVAQCGLLLATTIYLLID